MAQIKRFSNAIELTAKGTEEKIRVDFTDKRIVNKLLRLIKKYKNIDEYVAEKMKGVEEIIDSTVEYIREMGIDIQDKSELNDENIEKFLKDKVPENKKEEVKKEIEGANFEIMLAASDAEIEILENFRDEVNDAFNANITGLMFGDTLPALELYIELFEAITPYIQKAKANENKMIQAINEKYNLKKNVVDFPERKEI
jgi:histone acetyltransferase (RNA polymerase elongator complex component)